MLIKTVECFNNETGSVFHIGMFFKHVFTINFIIVHFEHLKIKSFLKKPKISLQDEAQTVSLFL